jgi:stress-induced morphogen
MLARASASAAATLARGARAAGTMASTDGPTAALIRSRLTAAFAPVTHLELEDESRRHSRGAESHFKVFLVSPAFEGVPLVQRHRLVMDAVKAGAVDLPFHALSISAKTPAQWDAGAAMQKTPGCAGHAPK